MTGPEHYRAAEIALETVRKAVVEGRRLNSDDVEATIAAAQVHATLALVAATAVVEDDETEWKTALGRSQ